MLKFGWSVVKMKYSKPYLQLPSVVRLGLARFAEQWIPPRHKQTYSHVANKFGLASFPFKDLKKLLGYPRRN
jgi:hypothetical protein